METSKIISMSSAMTLVHFSLSILLFIASIMIFNAKNVIHFNSFTMIILSFWMIFTGLHGWRHFDQYYFMYTYAGRGVFYFFTGLLVWGSNETEFYSTVVSLLFLLFGLAGMGLGLFSSYEPPRPLLGPVDFVPYRQKEIALASQADFMDDSPPPSQQNSTFTI
ncbi:hypothetical protein DDB_G0285107 [Dictyostelium discoideum AX4]|uniref:Transmembrane protein n=1 Tax=Dictyostelium discoideum TaxID=44689 RepID=Q54NP9_DICDI|nr:hypothetical protein DDB_G0285107 [Dictyostelium discoideum AX4]EAL64866.1 hypothetical protein DDB_G0285107 [Dictyostelium discoideum AX4]|eukprot:XP_639867.1 hypothetical protein DDB_G0285107 [Dictyostelium discoideum AX4]